MKDNGTSAQLSALDEALWTALCVGDGLPLVLVADSLLGCAAVACLQAGLTEQQVIDAALRAMRQLKKPSTLGGVHVLPVAPAQA